MKPQLLSAIQDGLLQVKDPTCATLTTLGITLQSPSQQQGWLPHVTIRAQKAKGIFYMMINNGLLISSLTANSNIKIYLMVLIHILSYGLQLIDLIPVTQLLFDKTQVFILKKILVLPIVAHTKWVLWEAGVLSAPTLANLIKAKAWRKYILNQNSRTHHPTNPMSVPLRPFFNNEVTNILTTWNIPPNKIERWCKGLNFPGKKK
jgi:hypothetical protein